MDSSQTFILPRYVEKNDQQIFSWDETKIIVNIPKEDKLMLANVFKGRMISQNIYPLIYDTYTDIKEIKYRSLAFYTDLINACVSYDMIPHEYQIYFEIGIRDLFMASYMGILNVDEIDLLRQVIEIIPDHKSFHTHGMDISYYPTSTKKLIRYIDGKEFSDPEIEPYFIKNTAFMYMIFVDPSDLSYHNFENIIPLDNYLNQFDKMKFNISNMYKHYEGIYSFSLSGSMEILLHLNNLNLYVEPFNKSSRGGKRFIFFSNELIFGIDKNI